MSEVPSPEDVEFLIESFKANVKAYPVTFAFVVFMVCFNILFFIDFLARS